jgi:hypothetical protein
LAIVLVAGLAVFVGLAGRRSQNLVTIENRSGQAIATLRITVGGQTSTFRDVAMGAGVTAPLGDKADTRFKLEGQLANGTMLRGQGVAGEGIDLIVLPGGEIKVRQGEKAPH